MSTETWRRTGRCDGGSLILHEITTHRIERFKRERLAGKWRGYKTTGPAKPIRPATVNRELDCLRTILAKAVEWGKLLENPASRVKRLKVDNRRTRILTETEQHAILGACRRKLRGIVTLALITGARIGELLALRGEHCQDGYVTFLETKSGRLRRIPISPAIEAVGDFRTLIDADAGSVYAPNRGRSARSICRG